MADRPPTHDVLPDRLEPGDEVWNDAHGVLRVESIERNRKGRTPYYRVTLSTPDGRSSTVNYPPGVHFARLGDDPHWYTRPRGRRG